MLSPFEPTCNRSAGDLDDSLTNVRKKICYNYITQFWCWNDFSPFSATLTFFWLVILVERHHHFYGNFSQSKHQLDGSWQKEEKKTLSCCDSKESPRDSFFT